MPGSDTPIDFRTMARMCFGHSARRTANLLTRHYNAHLAPLGLEITQVQLLAVIAEGSAGSASDIARFLGIDRSTLARNLKPLEAKGWITRAQSKGRRVLPTLTDDGAKMIPQLHAIWLEAQNAIASELGADRAAAYHEHLSALRQAVRTLEARESAPNTPSDTFQSHTYGETGDEPS